MLRKLIACAVLVASASTVSIAAKADDMHDQMHDRMMHDHMMHERMMHHRMMMRHHHHMMHDHMMHHDM